MTEQEKRANKQTFHFCCMLTQIEEDIEIVKKHYKETGSAKDVSTLYKLQNNYKQISAHVNVITQGTMF